MYANRNVKTCSCRALWFPVSALWRSGGIFTIKLPLVFFILCWILSTLWYENALGMVPRNFLRILMDGQLALISGRTGSPGKFWVHLQFQWVRLFYSVRSEQVQIFWTFFKRPLIFLEVYPHCWKILNSAIFMLIPSYLSIPTYYLSLSEEILCLIHHKHPKHLEQKLQPFSVLLIK
jgi:hypothetical protein